MAEHLLPTPALQRWVEQLWLAAGCSADEARLTAEHLVGADLAGHDSHGVGMVPRYVQSWLAGELQLNQHVKVLSDSGSMLSLDAQRGMGQSMAYEAIAPGHRACAPAWCVRDGAAPCAPHRPHRPLGRAGGECRPDLGALRQCAEQAGGGAVPRHRGALRHQPLYRGHPGAGPRAGAAGLRDQRHCDGQGARGLQQRQEGAGQHADGPAGRGATPTTRARCSRPTAAPAAHWCPSRSTRVMRWPWSARCSVQP